MPTIKKLSTCLWFEDHAEEAARFYTQVFPNSKVVATTRYTEAGQELHGRAPGSVMTVQFELDGHPFTGLNGGPMFKFTEAVSFEIHCETQADIDHFWARLSEGADPEAQQCGWLKDRYGVSWQVVPAALEQMFTDDDHARQARVMNVMLKMKKLDVATLQRAYDGTL